MGGLRAGDQQHRQLKLDSIPGLGEAGRLLTASGLGEKATN